MKMIDDFPPINATPRTASTIGDIAKAIADAVVQDLSIVGISLRPDLVALIREWQEAEAAWHGIGGGSQATHKRLSAAEEALRNVKVSA